MHRECGGMNGFTVPTGKLVSHPRKRHFTSSTQEELKWDQLLCGHEIEFTHTADETNQEEERFKIKQEEDQRKEINHKVTHWLDDRHQGIQTDMQVRRGGGGKSSKWGTNRDRLYFHMYVWFAREFSYPSTGHWTEPIDLLFVLQSACYSTSYPLVPQIATGHVENDLIRQECRRKCQPN